MTAKQPTARELHKNVPPDWYFASIKRNPFQAFWHRRRFIEVEKLIEPNADRILDIGCADGVFTKVILDKSKARRVIGIDILPRSIAWARKHWRRNRRLEFLLGDAHKLEFPAGSFDAVFALEVLEHVFDPQKVFREVKRVLKKGGYVVFLVPSDNRLFAIIWWFVTNFAWARIWKDCHIQSFSKKNRLGLAVAKSGLKVEVDRSFLLGMLNVVKARK